MCNLVCLQIAKEILLKPPAQRFFDDIRQLVPLFKNIKLFKDQNIQDSELPEIVQCLTYQTFKPGENVFEYGNQGDKFYMILSGEVSVLIPNPECRNFAHWLQKYHEEIIIMEKQIEVEKKRLALI